MRHLDRSLNFILRHSAQLARCAWPIVLLSGCAELHSRHGVLSPAGPQSLWIARVWWVYFWVCVAVFILVVGALFLGYLLAQSRRYRLRPEDRDIPVTSPDHRGERHRMFIVGSSIGITACVLIFLLVWNIIGANHVHAMTAANPVTIKITGHQWWWQVTYENENPSLTLTTANEIHIPAGQPVKFELHSADVIHSFWVPNLQGKMDLIPGHPGMMWLQADKPGEFIGQCGEFCGLEHARMRIIVIAEPKDQFDAWMAAQLEPANPPSSALELRGQKVFMTGSCVMCHTIAGTQAHAILGPNLTHIASRQRLAGNSIRNNIGHLAGWVLDPQRIKPGVLMPQNNLSPADLRALLEYLQSLK